MSAQEGVKGMQIPDSWPNYPLLPVKKYNEGSTGLDAMECGVLVAGKGPTVFLANMWSLTSMSDLEGVKTKAYPSFEALQEDGWIVD